MIQNHIPLEMVWVALLWAAAFRVVRASIYEIDYIADDHTYTEGNMYDSDHGPFGISGDSKIVANLDVEATSLMPGVAMRETPRIVLTFYHHDGSSKSEMFGNTAELNICQATDEQFEQSVIGFGMSSTKRLSFKTVANKKIHIRPDKAYYTVQERGLQFLRITVCPRTSLAQVKVNGTLAYRNPYGFLAGELYPLLPFEAILTACYIVLDLVFLLLIYCYRAEVLRLQMAIFCVLVLATGETASWTMAFVSMNDTGSPACCPYPPVLEAAVILQMLRKTVCRVLLLVVCLGLGMVYPRLERHTVIRVAVLGVGYLVSGLAEKVEQITESNEDYQKRGGQAVTLFALASFLLNLIFLAWIYTALGKTQQDLVQNNQTLKLKMYKALASTLGFFVFLFFTMTIVSIAHRSGATVWPWDWRWLLDVGFFDDGAFWSVLNFAVLAAMCWIWRPSAQCSQYALSSQIPSEDTGVEMSVASADRISSSHGDDDGSDASGSGSIGQKPRRHLSNARAGPVDLSDIDIQASVDDDDEVDVDLFVSGKMSSQESSV